MIDKVAMGAGFPSCTSALRCQYHSTNALCSSSSTRYVYRKDKRMKPGSLPKCTAFFGNCGALDRKVLALVFNGLMNGKG